MDNHGDDNQCSLTVLPSIEDNLIPNAKKYGIWHSKQKSFKPKVIPNLKEKELSLLKLYKSIELNSKQKRDFHVLLIRMSSIKDLINVSKDIFNDIKDTICCSDKRCLCDPTNRLRQSLKSDYQYQIAKHTFGKAADDFEIDKLDELKSTNKELIKINKHLVKLRGIIKHEDEDLNNFVNVLLLHKDVQYNKEIFRYLQKKIREYM